MEKLFKLQEHGTNPRTEIIGGVTTFLAMAYILAINPSILADAGLPADAVFTATCISAAFGTLFMAFFANYPIALASGMGLNAYFAYSVCVPMAEAGIQDPYTIALTAILVEGIVFVLLTACKFREALVNDIPKNLKLGITAGIGLFICIVGLKGAGIVVASPSTLIALGDMSSASVALALIGFVIMGILYHYKVPGYIPLGIILTWILGIVAQACGWYAVDAAAGATTLLPNFSNGLQIAAPVMFGFDFSYVANHAIEFAVIVFSFLFVDLFDTAGVLVGVASMGGMLDENGNLPKAKQALFADAVSTILGACLGTSTVTSYVESSAGVSAGARTGMASLVTGLLFLAALPLAPLFLAIPGFATTPALMFVGLLMTSSVREMDFSEDAANALAGFLAITMMPFTYSIANGIMFAVLAFVVIRIAQGKAKEMHPVMWIAAVLFLVRMLQLILGL